MPSNTKSDNQYFGKYFERATVEKINQSGIIVDPTQYKDTCGYDFSPEEIQYLNDEAELVGNYIGHDIHSIHTGDHTATKTGDIHLDDGTIIELKRVSAGTGTYHNTSIYYFTSFGFNFKDYMNKFKLRETIEKFFPEVKVKYNDNSPVNKDDSSYIRHSSKDGYNEIKVIDEAMRKQFVQDLVQFFRENPDKAQIFYKDMVLKKKIRQETYSISDRFIVFNYSKNTISEINLKKIKENPDDSIYVNDLGFCMGGLRFQIGWQNGSGLNNPTIRVFIK